MKKYLICIIIAVLISSGIFYYNNFVFIQYNKPVKINASQIINEDGQEKTVRLSYQLTRLKMLSSLSLYIKYNDDLSCLKELPHLDKLTLIPTDETARNNCDLKSLSQMSNVKHLTLCCFINEDIEGTFLGILENLESISCMDSNIWNWDYVGNLNKLTKIRIVMLHEYTKFKWDGLSFSKSLEEFDASGIYYDKILLENLEAIPSLKK